MAKPPMMPAPLLVRVGAVTNRCVSDPSVVPSLGPAKITVAPDPASRLRLANCSVLFLPLVLSAWLVVIVVNPLSRFSTPSVSE